MFKKVLVANRGEIACRVLRTLREMGVSSVAVYSEADATSLHVRLADEAICIGPAPSSDSYLRADRILEATVDSGAQAIHPGYGFLSENAEFAEACSDHGIVFIGPLPMSIRTMGQKIVARQSMMEAGVPVVPGTTTTLIDTTDAVQLAEEVGYPILLKAAVGGGGKGMRLVHSEDEIESAFGSARREAESSFGDGSLYAEKAILNPRHIEIQIAADEHGNVVHLFERECSVQRRHQKVIEESPACGLDPAIRDEMGRIACQGAAAICYTGVGTFEFLVDQEQNFYFLEMNTRLQVEHPVTELVTGIDLCRLQLMIAAGEPLPFTQDDIKQRGHAIECRVYAEDPEENFAPAPGKLERYRPPFGAGIRVDDGVQEGDEIPVFYDPMIAKLCVWAEHRSDCIDRARSALTEYEIEGIRHNLSFLDWILASDPFQKGVYSTNLLDDLGKFSAPEIPEALDDLMLVAACLSHDLNSQKNANNPTTPSGAVTTQPSGWRRATQNRGGW
jgi:acetyl-CoA carboxylase biotin carboxylase subunit